GLTTQELCAIGSTVGADVPFALVGGTARVGGFGERIEPLPAMPDCFFVAVMPGYGISTPQAFAAYDKVGTKQRPATDKAVEALRRGDYNALCPCLANVLEQASGGKDTERIGAALRREGADAALMTGSGAVVYGMFRNEETAEKALLQLKRHWQKVWVLRPVPYGARVETTAKLHF
ncbi:MAG: 4-(cytidine 5'-diphospho)-2-C-methyl-D-erythritol kinase, partial [Pygmaiobacter sp.]